MTQLWIGSSQGWNNGLGFNAFSPWTASMRCGVLALLCAIGMGVFVPPASAEEMGEPNLDKNLASALR